MTRTNREQEDEVDTTTMDNEAFLKYIGDYKGGAIRRITLKNFLTYENAVISPGPRLNVVVGANGTGKSSILNAICLGLGGEPKVLGRADDARAFVMHGKEKAMIEIELQPPEDENNAPTVFRREIDRNKGSERGRGRGASTFYLDGNRVTIDQVKATVKDTYHISLANLCTFLPQDKVGNFSGLNAQDLLLETEKTLSASEHLYKTHMQLIESQKELQGGDGDLHALESRLEKLKKEFSMLEREKERAEEREQAMVHVQLLKQKRIWLKVDHFRQVACDLKEKKSAIKQQIKDARAALEPLRRKHEGLVEEKQGLENTLRSAVQQVAQAEGEVKKQQKKFETHDEAVDDVFVQITEIDTKRTQLEMQHREQEERAARFEQMCKEVEASSAGIQEATQQEKEALSHARHAMKNADREGREVHSQLGELEDEAKRFSDRLARLQNESEQRKERVFRMFPQMRQITAIIHENRQKFRRPVHGPVACEIEVDSPDAAAFLEQHVPKTLLRGFIVETREDQDLLYEVVRNQRNIPINIYLVPHGRLENIRRPYSERRMTMFRDQHGVHNYLDELIKAKDPVMQALRTQAAIHRVLVGGSRALDGMDRNGLLELLAQTEDGSGRLQSFVLCASGHNRYTKATARVSEYSKKLSTRHDDVRQASILAPGTDPAVLQEVQSKLEQIHEKMNELRPRLQKAQLEKQEQERAAQEINSRLQALKDKIDSERKLISKRDTAIRKLREIEKNLQNDNTEQEKREAFLLLQKRVSASTAALVASQEAQRQSAEATVLVTKVNLQKSGISAAERQTRMELEEMSGAYKEIENEAHRIQQDFNQAKENLASFRKTAEQQAPLEDSNGNPTPLRAQLESLEIDTIADIDAAVEETNAKISDIHENQDAIRMYHEKKKQIEEADEKLQDAKHAKEGKAMEIASKLNPWRLALESKVGKIDTLFTEYMSEMGCTGSVRLSKGDDESNFAGWGIEIIVSFREGTKAQVLSDRVQSGGERSVSTIMYLMALQDMMVAPFRCVDEINQGLDERNERLVFKRIVENSTARPPQQDSLKHSGQYFLITPKLLPNLYDMEEEGVTILFVFNGKYSFQSPLEWNLADICEGVSDDAPPTKKRRSK